MPWYKTGTVAVTNGSTTVTGTGTAFAANARVGDAFRGPDGLWYELVNVASDTVLSISPAYASATNATGGYALAPMQGYVKDSADQLRTFVNLYGTKLAALGTTGNYDILPLAKGGTGVNAANAAAALAALGGAPLASPSLTGVPLAPTAAVGANTTQIATMAALLAGMGAFGLGSLVPAVTDVNTLGGGNTTFFRAGSSASNIPAAAAVGGLYIGYGATAGVMICGTLSASATIGNKLWWKCYNGGTWGAWNPAAAAGANSDITSLTGLTTPLSVAQGGTGGNTQATARTSLGLGAASTFDTVPVANGGTGGNTQAAARTALGLGVASQVSFGGIELSAVAPYIDFHYNNTTTDYDVRLINDASGVLSVSGNFAFNGLYCRTGVNGTRQAQVYNFNWTGSAIDAYIGATYVGSVSLFTSDYRIKKYVKDVEGISFLDRIDAYRIVNFQKKILGDVFKGDGTVYQGLIAHEVQAVNPLAASGEKDGMDEGGNPLIQQLDPIALITDLMGAIKELRAEVNALKAAQVAA